MNLPGHCRTFTLLAGMYGIKDLAELLKLSEKQVRRRLSLILPYLDGHCRKGPRGKILVDERGLEILRAVTLREREGTSLTEAARLIIGELQRSNNNGHVASENSVREGAGTSGNVVAKSVEQGIESRDSNQALDTLPHLPAPSGKVKVHAGLLWAILAVGFVAVGLEIAILLLVLGR